VQRELAVSTAAAATSDAKATAARDADDAARRALDTALARVQALQHERDDLAAQYDQAMDNAAHLELRAAQAETARDSAAQELLRAAETARAARAAAERERDTARALLDGARAEAERVAAELAACVLADWRCCCLLR
jgi:predicted  nucleic acid-binding Zn-ribbon protein